MMDEQEKLNKTLMKANHTIVKALSVINEGTLQIALIVDDENRLLGTVTDGDIRRGILSGVALESPVTYIMNKNPVSASVNTGPDDILDLMQSKKIYQIPILDAKGRVIAIERIRPLLQKKQTQPTTKSGLIKHRNNKNIPVVLMLGGEGKRLHPLTQDLPKPMVSVGGKPLLETILQNFVSQGFEKFYFSLNYKADIIRDHFQDGSKFGAYISYLLEDKKMGTAGSLGLIQDTISAPLIVMNGDLLTNVDFEHVVEFHDQNQVMATMCVREYCHEVPYGIVQNTGTKLDTIVEKPMHSYFVNAGIYVLNPESLDLIPQSEYFDMPQLFEKIREQGKESAVFPIHEYWLDIGRFEDLERARTEYDKIFG